MLVLFLLVSLSQNWKILLVNENKWKMETSGEETFVEINERVIVLELNAPKTRCC